MMLAGCGQNVYKKGVESLENKDYAAAQENFRKAVEDKKNVADSYRGLGIAYYEQEKYKDALAAFENAVSAGTKETGTICNMMAVCKMQTENYEDAISYYEKALDHSDCSDDMKQEIADIANLEVGDTIFFIADTEEHAALYAGQIRNELGARLDLLEKNAYRFCFINDFPMFEYDKEAKKIIFTHNPFSMPQGGLEALNTKDPRDILAYQYDIVCNGVELSSGAVRNHNLDIMVKAFEIAGYTEEDLKEKFGALYNAFQFGAPPHAGMAPGVDRMIMLLRNEENIREVIPFPMNGNAQDVMCGAPNEVSEMQLREVHIKVRK